MTRQEWIRLYRECRMGTILPDWSKEDTIALAIYTAKLYRRGKIPKN